MYNHTNIKWLTTDFGYGTFIFATHFILEDTIKPINYVQSKTLPADTGYAYFLSFSLPSY